MVVTFERDRGNRSMDKRFRCKARSVKYTARLERESWREGGGSNPAGRSKRWFFRIKSRGQSALRTCDRPPPTNCSALFPPFPRLLRSNDPPDRSSAFHGFQLINRYPLRQTCELQTCRLNAVFRSKYPRISIKLGRTWKFRLEGIEMRRCHRWYTFQRRRHFSTCLFQQQERKEELLISRFSNSIHVLKFHRGCSSRPTILIRVCIHEQRDLQTRLHLRKHHCQY